MRPRKKISYKATAGNGRHSIAAVAAAKAADAGEPELTMPSLGYLGAPALLGTQDEWQDMRLGVWHECCDAIRAAGFKATAAYAIAIETFAGSVVLNRITGGAKGTQEIIKFVQLFCMSPSGKARHLDAENPAKEAESVPLAPLGMGAIMAAIKRVN